MNALELIAGYYPAVIAIFGLLCQFQLYIPGERDLPPSNTSKSKKPNIHTENDNIVSQQQKDSKDLPIEIDPEGQNPPTTIRSRRTMWFAAFWLLPQCYCLLKMGNNISAAERLKPGFVWTVPIALFLPTLVTSISMAKFGQAMEAIESSQRLGNGPKERYYMSGVTVGLTIFLLVLIPWIQAGWALIKYVIS